MPTFYVATRARDVIVEADDEAEARRLAEPELQKLQAGVSACIGRDLPVEIHVIRPATDDEIELGRWNRELLGQWVGKQANARATLRSRRNVSDGDVSGGLCLSA